MRRTMSTTLYFFPHAALSFVRDGDSQAHAHRALQLSVALEGHIRSLEDGRWEEHLFLACSPQQPHRIRTTGALCAHLFIDPGPRCHQLWSAAGAVPSIPGLDLIAALRALADGPRDEIRAHELTWEWLSQSLPGLLPDGAPADPRIQRALAHLEANPDAASNHRELAQLTHLSVSRFAERFRLETGMAVRNYLLWRRLLRSVAALQAGASVTDAALDGGFADTAHLSRSFRRTFGAAPTDIG